MADKKIVNTADQLKKCIEDLGALLKGEIGPTQQAYIDKINKDWNAYNFIVVFGHAYKLTNKVIKKDNGAYRSPCDLCKLAEFCVKDSEHTICNMLQASDDEYFIDAGELCYDKNKKMSIEGWK